MTHFSNRARNLAALAGVAILLGACASATDYSSEYADDDAQVPSFNVVNGLMQGLGAIPANERAIRYEPRAPLVVPPNTTALAQPESPRTLTEQANWPKDREEEIRAANRKPEYQRRQRAGLSTPMEAYLNDDDNTLRPSELMRLRTPPREVGAPPLPGTYYGGQTALYDANGNPVRASLTAPPVAYLQPEGSGETAPQAPAKKHWTIDDWF